MSNNGPLDSLASEKDYHKVSITFYVASYNCRYEDEYVRKTR